MYNSIVILAFAALTLFACKNGGSNSENGGASSKFAPEIQAKFDEGMKYHDEVMPLTSQIEQLQDSLTQFTQPVFTKNDTAMMRRINSAKQNLGKAKGNMMDLMANMQTPDEVKPDTAAIVFEVFRQDAKMVADLYKSSIRDATELLTLLNTKYRAEPVIIGNVPPEPKKK
jgi:hypothetical protein